MGLTKDTYKSTAAAIVTTSAASVTPTAPVAVTLIVTGSPVHGVISGAPHAGLAVPPFLHVVHLIPHELFTPVGGGGGGRGGGGRGRPLSLFLTFPAKEMLPLKSTGI